MKVTAWVRAKVRVRVSVTVAAMFRVSVRT